MDRKYIGILLTSLLFFGIFFIVASLLITHCSHAHWERYRIPEYEFKNMQIQFDFCNWLDTLVYEHHIESHRKLHEDFDFCYQPWTDYVWDSLNWTIVDSFNVRLHSHSYENNYLRSSGYEENIKGVCCVKSHILYLYDAQTISRFFSPKNRKKNIYRFIPDKHGFLDWRDEEVWLAYSNEYFRALNTQHVHHFNHLEFLFYDVINFADKSQFISSINRDTFCIRSCGPYLKFSVNDELNRETTRENFRIFLSKQMSTEMIDKMTDESYFYFVCKIDTLGNAVVENISSLDMKDAANMMIRTPPTFLPAMEQGQSVNSLVIYRFVKFDFCDTPRLLYNK